METILSERVVDERVEEGSFEEAVEFLSKRDPGVVVFDSDYTIRRPGEGRLGEISGETMGQLGMLKKLGWKLIFVSNQPEEGHQIARSIAERKGNYFFPDSLKKEFGEENVFGGGADFPLRHFKRTDEAVVRVTDRISEVLEDRRSVWMAGDRQTDEQFFDRVMNNLWERGLIVKAGFIKLPDSKVVKLVKKVRVVARLVERVMP